jgi:hypothetical protein
MLCFKHKKCLVIQTYFKQNNFDIVNVNQPWNPAYSIHHNVIFVAQQWYTRRNAQVVTNLQQTCCSNSNAVPTTCQQDVFALLVPSLLTTCYKVVELNGLVTSCSNNLLSSCNSTTCQQVASDNLVATW